MKKHNYSLIFGLILTGIILVITIIGQFWTPYDITGMNSLARNQAPSLMHIMGTDNFGRDVFSRVMNGCGTTFFVALSTVVIGCFFGFIIIPERPACFDLYQFYRNRQVQDHRGLGCDVYPEFCANCAKRSDTIQVPGICPQCPGDGSGQSENYICTYFAEYRCKHADSSGDRF